MNYKLQSKEAILLEIKGNFFQQHKKMVRLVEGVTTPLPRSSGNRLAPGLWAQELCIITLVLFVDALLPLDSNF